MIGGDKKMKKTLEQRKAELQKRLAIVNQKLSQKERKDDTRKKILVGAFYLEQFEKEPEIKQKFLIALDGYLTRDDDRALFNFEPLSLSKQKDHLRKFN